MTDRLISDEDIEREHAHQCQQEVDWADRTGRAVGFNHYRDFARRIEALVRKRLAERLRREIDLCTNDYGLGAEACVSIVESDE